MIINIRFLKQITSTVKSISIKLLMLTINPTRWIDPKNVIIWVDRITSLLNCFFRFCNNRKVIT